MQRPVAKIFATGGSQAVRLPAEFRFEGTSEVYIRRDEDTGDIILSTRSTGDWKTFMRLRDREDSVPGDFLIDREQREQRRDPFEGWKE